MNLQQSMPEEPDACDECKTAILPGQRIITIGLQDHDGGTAIEYQAHAECTAQRLGPEVAASLAPR